MKPRKLIMITLTYLSAMGMVSGCGRTQVDANQNQTITFWEPDDAGWQPLYKELVSDFEKSHPNITVKLINIPEDGYEQKLNTAFAAGLGPDVWVDYYDTEEYSKGYIQDLDSFIKQDNWNMNQYFQPITNIRTKGENGHYYALPRDVSVDTIFYNKTLFNKYHVPYPKAGWTMADFEQTAKELTHRQNKDYGMDGATGPGADWWLEGYPFVWDLGSDIISNDGWTASKFLDSPQTIQMVQVAQNMEKQGSVMPNALAQTFGSADYATFLSGHLGMTQGTLWGINQLQNTKFQWGSVPLPTPSGNTQNDSWADCVMYYMNAQSTHKAATWDFMKYMSGSSAAKVVIQSQTWIPDVKQAWIDTGLSTNSHFAASFEALNLPTKTADYERSPSWNTIVEPILSDVWNQIVTPDNDHYENVKQGLQQAAIQVQQALNREKSLQVP
ncbi:ABC transporter substrate-binding protein [Alicyclobacillus fastidiosus]|uniref:Sugar ABC transporter substrate-binding protein n=1 Tax=Alicyclobacillus fastidiosus TaxID=392011 RepID=A0ABV5AMJ5_9BACL|nr:sugar ABC transporter substrate-binding protein [Alicyclobacillus fastidiosus]WEH08304.1 sugar ABC transporter substrate-binding protein [Alicyclobacillus fastidiosus]